MDIQTVLGFSNTYRLGRWTPITVVVGNRGSDVVGQVEVQSTEGNEFQGNLFTMSHRRRLELPGDSRKRFRFTVFLETFSRPLVVRVTSGGRELARRTIDLRHRFTAGSLILVLSRDADLDYLNDSSGGTRRVLYPHPEFLPDRWQGYDGVEAVVLHGVSLEHVSVRQYEALKKWVAQGGVLAVSGGPDYALLRTPRLAALVPGTPVGVVQYSDGSTMEAALGEPLDAPRPFGVNRLAGHRGRVILRSGDTPLIIEERNGRGRVVYLTFDVTRYPFDTWPGMERMWLQVLALSPAEPVSFRAVEPRPESSVVAVVRGQTTDFPDHTTIVFFLALYLGLLATGYRLQPSGKAGRSLVRWSTWASPLIFAPAAYFLFGPLLFPKGATAVVVSVIEPFSPGPYAQVKLDLGMYSNRRRPLRFDFDGTEPVFRPVSRRASQGKTAHWVLGEDAGRSVQAEGHREFILHLLSGRDVITYDIQASAVQTEAGVRLHVRNNSGRHLSNAWLVFRANAYPLGSIPEDGDFQRALDSSSDALEPRHDSWETILRGTGDASGDDVSATQQLLAREIGEPGEARYAKPNEALLIGFSTGPLRPARASQSWQRRELTLVLYRLPVTLLPPMSETLGNEPM